MLRALPHQQAGSGPLCAIVQVKVTSAASPATSYTPFRVTLEADIQHLGASLLTLSADDGSGDVETHTYKLVNPKVEKKAKGNMFAIHITARSGAVIKLLHANKDAQERWYSAFKTTATVPSPAQKGVDEPHYARLEPHYARLVDQNTTAGYKRGKSGDSAADVEIEVRSEPQEPTYVDLVDVAGSVFSAHDTIEAPHALSFTPPVLPPRNLTASLTQTKSMSPLLRATQSKESPFESSPLREELISSTSYDDRVLVSAHTEHSSPNPHRKANYHRVPTRISAMHSPHRVPVFGNRGSTELAHDDFEVIGRMSPSVSQTIV